MKPYAIFDMDGTLIDSMPLWVNLGRDYLISQGVNPPDNLRQRLRTMSILESAEYFQQELGVTQTTQDIITGVNQIILDQYSLHIPLKPFVKQHLQQLKEAGTKMCVATASSRSLAEPALRRLGIMEYFEFLMTCDEENTNKNAPDIYLKAAQMLGGKPEETAVYEDALYAAKAAASAGFYIVGVHDPSQNKDAQQIKTLSDTYITSFRELL